jgi:putative DNA methylase
VAENGRRLIEDYLPIEVINQRATSEKTGRGAAHPASLHLWWARRPITASRAAVYATLVPAGHNPEEERDFIASMCTLEAPETALQRARQEILAAYGGTPPKVLDMFAGGGAIPLEAARLGCQVTAVELNPVAHLIEKCMLVYPQRCPGLADDVRKWGRRWVERAWKQLADLYQPVGPATGQQALFAGKDGARRPLAYLWTRTVRCPNPAMAEHHVPLVRQTWLARKPGRCVALKPVLDRSRMEVGWEVVESDRPEGLNFDPAAGSRRGDATCPICGSMVTVEYVKAEGIAGRIGVAALAAVVMKPSGRGREYLAAGSYPLPDDGECRQRIEALEVTPPQERLVVGDTMNIKVPLYGLTRFRDLFTPRQLLALCTLASGIREMFVEMATNSVPDERATAIATCCAMALDRLADANSTLTHWASSSHGETVNNTFARQALPMVWDFAETNPFGGSIGDAALSVETVARVIDGLGSLNPSVLIRGSACDLPLESDSQDAIITDPPYYDNISYADLSDFFYVWLKRSVGHLHPDDLGGELTPKRSEAVVAPYRHHGSRDEARAFYEATMRQAFEEAHRVLKPEAPLVCIYAHKTTLGWSALVEALRSARFTITEAWPLDTEMPERSAGQGTASLASSIFLVARKRVVNTGPGRETAVLDELDGIIAERLDRLSKAGISGSDIVIACVGAALRPFTQYDRVERDNGDPLPAQDFLVIVQNRVLDAIFGGLAGADPATRFYVASQYSYGYGQLPFDELNSLARMTGVELDGPRGFTAGHNPLAQKKGSKVWLRDFEVRGEDRHLGLPEELSALQPPVIDVAHGVLWRAEYRSSELKQYLADARPDAGLLRGVIQALAGRGLRTGSRDVKAPEAQAAERLLGSWRHLVEENLFS